MLYHRDPLRRESDVLSFPVFEFSLAFSAQIRSLIAVLFIASVTPMVRSGVNAQDRPVLQPTKAPRADLEILSNLFRGIGQISEHLQAKDLRSIHNDQITVSSAIDILGQKTSLDVEQRRSLQQALGVLNRKIVDTHRLADAGDQRGAEKIFTNEVLPALQTVKGCYPEDLLNAALALPEKSLCPMHPEVVGRRSETCPKCGMRLKPASPLSFLAGQQSSIRANIKTDGPLETSVRLKARLRLCKENGAPVLPNDLQTAHTEKIHLLIIDRSLTDYHHEHPRPGATPGEYAFSFLPRKAGAYRLWADLLPMDTGRQEYAMTDIESDQEAEALPDKKVQLSSVVEGLQYDLSFEKPEIRVNDPARAKLRITYLNGMPFLKLEPIMGTFAHVVGFHEDYRTILHIHPMGEDPAGPEDRGGPELEFILYAPKPGFIRLFAQVQIGGISQFAPLGINVVP